MRSKTKIKFSYKKPCLHDLKRNCSVWGVDCIDGTGADPDCATGTTAGSRCLPTGNGAITLCDTGSGGGGPPPCVAGSGG